jgi:hypothetical protein
MITGTIFAGISLSSFFLAVDRSLPDFNPGDDPIPLLLILAKLNASRTFVPMFRVCAVRPRRLHRIALTQGIG